MIAPATPEGEEDADEHHHRCNVQDVEGCFCYERAKMKAAHGNAENESAIHVLVVDGTLKANPSERQWKRDGCRQQASPRQEPVGRPAQRRSALNESLQNYEIPDDRHQVRE